MKHAGVCTSRHTHTHTHTHTQVHEGAGDQAYDFARTISSHRPLPRLHSPKATHVSTPPAAAAATVAARAPGPRVDQFGIPEGAGQGTQVSQSPHVKRLREREERRRVLGMTAGEARGALGAYFSGLISGAKHQDATARPSYYRARDRARRQSLVQVARALPLLLSVPACLLMAVCLLIMCVCVCISVYVSLCLFLYLSVFLCLYAH